MKNKSISAQLFGNAEDKLLKHAQEKLGLYIYVLIDPRNGEIFYIGKGGGAADGTGNERVLHHFEEAKAYVRRDAEQSPSAKIKRILEIWNDERDVQWWIIRRSIECQKTCDQIEAALIDVFSLTKTKTLNAIRGYGSKESGLISSKDVLLLNPPPVNPKKQHELVFLFPINQLIGERADLYESTRQYWNVKKEWRGVRAGIGIGVNTKTSAACFEIKQWRPSRGKYAFTGLDVTDTHELARKDLTKIIDSAKGYWQYGQFLVVEFNGKGSFRFLRGNANKEWIDL
jgi:hypothetical protein